MQKLWDISQTLRPDIPVWPGDTAYSAERTWLLEGECPVNVAKFNLSTHTGTHADAPLHYHAEGKAIADVALEFYIGPCIVLDATAANEIVLPEHIEAELPDRVERVLLKTYQTFPKNNWVEHYTAVSADAIDLIAARGGVLVGVDSPSLDPQQAKNLTAHKAVQRNKMAILEGLVLDDILPGHYELVAPPLKLADMDAAPLRALLRSIEK